MVKYDREKHEMQIREYLENKCVKIGKCIAKINQKHTKLQNYFKAKHGQIPDKLKKLLLDLSGDINAFNECVQDGKTALQRVTTRANFDQSLILLSEAVTTLDDKKPFPEMLQEWKKEKKIDLIGTQEIDAIMTKMLVAIDDILKESPKEIDVDEILFEPPLAVTFLNKAYKKLQEADGITCSLQGTMESIAVELAQQQRGEKRKHEEMEMDEARAISLAMESNVKISRGE